MSLVMSLSVTLATLRWENIPGDNSEAVGARGILYLLIFQQLGQVVRWSWGYHVLLGPRKECEELDDGTLAEEANTDRGDSDTENGRGIMQAKDTAGDLSNGTAALDQPYPGSTLRYSTCTPPYCLDRPYTATSTTTTSTSTSTSATLMVSNEARSLSQETLVSETRSTQPDGNDTSSNPPAGLAAHPPLDKASHSQTPISRPRKVWQCISKVAVKVYTAIIAFMNPPLWAMLIAITIASIPPLKNIFFSQGTFIHSSITRAVGQLGNVAVPLVLVVLGASLGSNGATTEPSPSSVRAARQNNKLLIASLLSRMVLPFIIMAPLLAVAAKYLPISILGDPIFVVVCYLLVGAPSALQLAQICQINGIYETVIARIMFWSYVVVVLPSTVALVVTAVQVVGWAAK